MIAVRKRLLLFIVVITHAQVREHLLMDFNWRFAFGNPYDTKKDFNKGTSYFSYLTKAGYGDGTAALILTTAPGDCSIFRTTGQKSNPSVKKLALS